MKTIKSKGNPKMMAAVMVRNTDGFKVNDDVKLESSDNGGGPAIRKISRIVDAGDGIWSTIEFYAYPS
ncbi:MAG TPA: hypothetical protein VHB54_09510 [Mucilaginibacter sp.]|nr:hypothetical protein [Mucilaginibacter sp.]